VITGSKIFGVRVLDLAVASGRALASVIQDEVQYSVTAFRKKKLLRRVKRRHFLEQAF
jgi:hypothetical protein